MIENALKAGFPRATVLGDCGYGNNSVFRETLSAWNLQYALEIQGTTKLRVLDATGVAGERISAAEAGRSLARRLRNVTWREGTKRPLSSRFARVRVIVEKDDDIAGSQSEWLLVEWPEGEAHPTKFVLSTLPAKIPLSDLVNTFKMRWRIERSYEDLKGELGLDHYEGRSFVGWHHHVSVVLACYAFLVAEHARSFPPSAKRTSRTSTLKRAS
jgi:SRSO17 transposase